MKKMLFNLIIIIFLVSCSNVDEKGFYTSGENKGLHQETKTKYNQEGYDKQGFNRDGINKVTGTEYSKDGYDRNGWNKNGWNKETSSYYDKFGYDRNGWNKRRINRDTNTKYDKNGYDKFGYNRKGYDNEGYDKYGWNRQGVNKETGTEFDNHGYDKEDYDRYGWNRQGINKETGTEFDNHGYDKYGYNRKGYDKDGYNKDGWNKNGMNKETGTKQDDLGLTKEEFYQKTGIWRIQYFTDEYGDKTEQCYITNHFDGIDGAFSNSATTNSDLNVSLVITEYGIFLVFYEYGHIQVKHHSETIFYGKMMDTNGYEKSITGTYYGDRMIFSSDISDKIENALMEGGKIKFYFKEVTEYGTPSSYRFTIRNADFFNRIYKQMLNK